MNKQKSEIYGILISLLAFFILISFISYNPLESPAGFSNEIAKKNFMGIFGIYISYYLMKYSFGWGALFIPIILSIIGYNLFIGKNIQKQIGNLIHIMFLGVWISVCTACLGNYLGGVWIAEYPGLAGYVIWKFLIGIFGYYSTVLIIFFMGLILFASIMKVSIYESVLELYKKINFKLSIIRFREGLKKKYLKFFFNDSKEYQTDIAESNNPKQFIEEIDLNNNDGNIDAKEKLQKNELEEKNCINNQSQGVASSEIASIDNNSIKDEQIISEDLQEINENNLEKIHIEDLKEVVEGDLDAEKERKSKYFQYKMPTLDYLYDSPNEEIDVHLEGDLKDKANQLVHALETFGVSGRVVRISPGPVITLFEIEPAEGVRVNKFTNLSDDLARVMKAQRVRIIAPIPGSKSVGVELPNKNPAIVYIKNIINSKEYIDSKSKLSISLGKTTTGEAFIFDLGKMPHLLVAGATGAGKSVCINTIIISILYKAKPDEVKFILMDPKKLELATYKSLVGYHLITASKLDEYVMTTAENSVSILDSAIVEMERRFQVFADARVRNISEYHNRRMKNNSLESIPYIIVIIDELADLMMTSGRAIEEPITRLAQKARAVGIHLVVATQRPSVDVITGLIKSNFPARISFQVSSKIDSRTIIDQMGAEKLLGKGDMLFLLPGTAAPIRLHNAYITLDEIELIMKHIASQPKPEEISLPESTKKIDGVEINIEGEQDELLRDAAILVVQSQQASVSLLQRKFRIGYSRAGRLIDELESLGIVSGYSGSKARDVLIDEAYIDSIFDQN